MTGWNAKNVTLEPIVVDTEAGTGKWDCRVRYVKPEKIPPEVGESNFSFDTGGGTQHITQSLSTIGPLRGQWYLLPISVERLVLPMITWKGWI